MTNVVRLNEVGRMKLITVDFETYFSKDIGFAKQTTEEYIRDPEFHVIGVAVKDGDEPTEWASGTEQQIKQWLDKFDWENSVALAHNAMFDGSILNWHFDIKPKFWMDTLCMGRAIHGVEVGGSLGVLAERYALGQKGDATKWAMGLRRTDFTEQQLADYGDYCINDVELTHKLFYRMLLGFPKKELHLINLTLRMFTEPVLRLDISLLQQHKTDIFDQKEALYDTLGIPRHEAEETLMSNKKFAAALRKLEIEPPVKISATTGKETLALAKTDEEFKALASHPKHEVQALVAARLGAKSTLEETRTDRFIGIASRGTLPVPVKYYAAHTGRWGGDDKINLQNLPSRGENAGKLKMAIKAPPGQTMIDADSSQIEARVLAWLAGQNDIVKAFANKEDVYKKMAASIYGKKEADVTPQERFVGKTTVLGCGYGMGAVKFQAALKNSSPPVELPLDECHRIINAYRKTNYAIAAVWKQAQQAIINMSRGDPALIGRAGVLKVVPKERAIMLPSGLLLRYDDLKSEVGENGIEFSYKTRQGRTRIYGGKVIENVCQAIARCIIGEQMLRISKKYRVVLIVHDSIGIVVPKHIAAEAREYVEECMRWTPDWAAGLPVNCESGMAESYGGC